MSHYDPRTLLTAIHELEQLRDPAPEQWQRSFKRYPVRGDAELYPTDQTRIQREPITIQLRDVSCGGLGFVSPEPLLTNSIWRVSLSRRGTAVGGQSVAIRHCHMVQQGVFLVGAQFCAEPALLYLLGLDLAAIRDSAFSDGPDEVQHVAPSEVA